MLGRLKSSCRQWALNASAKSPWIATILFSFSGAFRREAWCVANGIVSADQGDGDTIGWRYTLRSYIHVLEKGISAKERKSIFGKGYVESSVKLFGRLQKHCQERSCDSNTILYSWARDVLIRYFEVVGSDPVIDKARQDFHNLIKDCPIQPGSGSLSPYKRNANALQITYNDFLALAQHRRSVRSYLPRTVPREMLSKAVHAASLSPSACNKQPFHFRFYDDPRLIEQLRTIPMGITAFSNVPCLMVLTGDLRGVFGSISTRHGIYVDASLAAMAFQLALETLGLSSCCINWSDVPERDNAVADALKLPNYERVVMFMVIGFSDPEALVAQSTKRALVDLQSYNKIGPIEITPH